MKHMGMQILIVLLASVVLLGGCSKKEPAAPSAPSASGGAGEIAGIDLTSAIGDLKAAAAKMDLPQLESTAKKYLEQITTKKGELTKLMDKFSAIPLTQKMGDEAKTLQGDISKLTESIGDLTQRFQVYVNAIKEKGGDISNFTMPK